VHSARWCWLLFYLVDDFIHVLFVAQVFGKTTNSWKRRVILLLKRHILLLSGLALGKGSFKILLVMLSAGVEFVFIKPLFFFFNFVESSHRRGRWLNLDSWEDVV